MSGETLGTHFRFQSKGVGGVELIEDHLGTIGKVGEWLADSSIVESTSCATHFSSSDGEGILTLDALFVFVVVETVGDDIGTNGST